MDKLRLVHGPEVMKALSAPGTKRFRYTANPAAVVTFGGLALVLYAVGAGIWFTDVSAESWLWRAGLVAALVFATGLSVLVTYWRGFARVSFVATSDDALVVGREDRAWVVGWELLDMKSLGLEEMEVSRSGGKLDVNVGGQHIPLLLYSPFVFLTDPQGFMFDLLSRFSALSAEELESMVEEEAAAEQAAEEYRDRDPGEGEG